MTTFKRLVVGLFALAVCGGAATVATYWHDGYRVYVVHTGSMMPTYNPGDVLIDKPVTDLHPGVVITFEHSHVSSDLVSHRITRIRHGLIHTKGDANRTPDVWEIEPSQVQGSVATSVPKLGYLLVFLKQRAGIGAVMTGFVAIALLWGLFFPNDVTAVEPARAAAANPAASRRAALG